MSNTLELFRIWDEAVAKAKKMNEDEEKAEKKQQKSKKVVE